MVLLILKRLTTALTVTVRADDRTTNGVSDGVESRLGKDRLPGIYQYSIQPSSHTVITHHSPVSDAAGSAAVRDRRRQGLGRQPHRR